MNEKLKLSLQGWVLCALCWATGALVALHSERILTEIPRVVLEIFLGALHFPMFIGMIVGSLAFLFWLEERGRE